MAAFNLKDVSVMLAMPVNRDIPIQTTISLLKTQDALSAKDIKLEFNFVIGSSIIQSARSKCAWNFLQSDKTRLFWVDSDIQWEADDFIRLLALSTVMDVVGAVYTAKKDPPVFAVDGDLSGERASNEYGCIAANGFGLGFTVVRREVIERLASESPVLSYPDLPQPIPSMFRCDVTDDGKFRGEDIAFFSDVRKLGYDVWFDPTINLGHIGPKVYQGRFMDAVAIKQLEE